MSGGKREVDRFIKSIPSSLMDRAYAIEMHGDGSVNIYFETEGDRDGQKFWADNQVVNDGLQEH